MEERRMQIMKRITLLAAVAVLALLTAACDLATGTVSNPGAAGYQDAAAAQDRADNAGTPFQVGGATPATVNTATNQEVVVSFTNGVVDGDSVAANVTLYPVTDPTNAFEAWVRGTAIALSSTVRDNLDGSSDLVLTFDGSAIATDRLELVIGSGLTANGGARQLNQDGDALAGEAEDDFIDYLTVTDTGVTGFTATTAGADRLPRATFSVQLFEDAALTTGFNNLLDQATLPTAIYLRGQSNNGQTGANYDGYAVPSAEVVKLYRLQEGGFTEISLTFARESEGGLLHDAFRRIR
jgi:hypothetical protein